MVSLATAFLLSPYECGPRIAVSGQAILGAVTINILAPEPDHSLRILFAREI